MKVGSQIPILLFFVLLVCLTAVKHIFLPFTPDNAVHVFAAELILEKGSLYPYFFETNPPLFPYLTTLPVLAASTLGLSPILVYRVFVYLAGGLAVFLTLREFRTVATNTSYYDIFAISAFLITLLLGLQGFGFGQRDHLVGVLFFPYAANLATRILKPDNSKIPLIVAFLLALGVAIKPHYLPVWLIGEAALLLRFRDWRTFIQRGNLIFVSAGFLYVGAALVLEPYFFSEILPMLLKTYDLIVYRLGLGLKLIWCGMTLAQLGALLWILRQPDSRARTVRAVYSSVFLLASQGAFLGFILQAGFPYQIWPFVLLSGGGFLAVFVRDEEFIDTGGEVRGSQGAAPAGHTKRLAIPIMMSSLLVTILATPLWVWQEAGRVPDRGLRYDEVWGRNFPKLQNHLEALNHFAEGGSYYVFSTNVSSIFPAALYSTSQWNFRYHILWPLPSVAFGALPSSNLNADETELISGKLLTQVTEDFEEFSPDVVLVDVSQQKTFFPEDDQGLRSFDYLAYFNQSSRFRKIFSNYTMCGGVEPRSGLLYSVFFHKDWAAEHSELCTPGELFPGRRPGDR